MRDVSNIVNDPLTFLEHNKEDDAMDIILAHPHNNDPPNFETLKRDMASIGIGVNGATRERAYLMDSAIVLVRDVSGNMEVKDLGSDPCNLDLESFYITHYFMLNIISWNVQGAASKRCIRNLKNLISMHRLHILIVLEQRIAGYGATRTCKQIGFSNFFKVKTTGFSGGI